MAGAAGRLRDQGDVLENPFDRELTEPGQPDELSIRTELIFGLAPEKFLANLQWEGQIDLFSEMERLSSADGAFRSLLHQRADGVLRVTNELLADSWDMVHTLAARLESLPVDLPTPSVLSYEDATSTIQSGLNGIPIDRYLNLGYLVQR